MGKKKKRPKGAPPWKNKKQRRHAVQSNQSNIHDQEQAQSSEGMQISCCRNQSIEQDQRSSLQGCACIVFPAQSHLLSNHGIAQLCLNRGVKRRLNMLSFYKFSQRLIQVATKYGTTILRGDERYTSKQCGNCGFIHDKLGSAEVFNCPKCRKEGLRDVHAARNILLKHLQRDQLR